MMALDVRQQVNFDAYLTKMSIRQNRWSILLLTIWHLSALHVIGHCYPVYRSTKAKQLLNISDIFIKFKWRFHPGGILTDPHFVRVGVGLRKCPKTVFIAPERGDIPTQWWVRISHRAIVRPNFKKNASIKTQKRERKRIENWINLYPTVVSGCLQTQWIGLKD